MSRPLYAFSSLLDYFTECRSSGTKDLDPNAVMDALAQLIAWIITYEKNLLTSLEFSHKVYLFGSSANSDPKGYEGYIEAYKNVSEAKDSAATLELEWAHILTVTPEGLRLEEQMEDGLWKIVRGHHCVETNTCCSCGGSPNSLTRHGDHLFCPRCKFGLEEEED